jgi:DNA-directed RNA polymerase specialized sigma24 family protein
MTLDWQHFIEIADKFQHKARPADRDDLRQDIILRLAEVASNNGHRPLTKPAMLRIASYVVMEYWHKLKRQPTILSLNYELDDGDGDKTELWQTLADDKAIDLDAWLNARVWLLGCPQRLVQIAVKLYSGKPLVWKDYKYLERNRQRELQKYQLALA